MQIVKEKSKQEKYLKTIKNRLGQYILLEYYERKSVRKDNFVKFQAVIWTFDGVPPKFNIPISFAKQKYYVDKKTNQIRIAKGFLSLNLEDLRLIILRWEELQEKLKGAALFFLQSKGITLNTEMPKYDVREIDLAPVPNSIRNVDIQI